MRVSGSHRFAPVLLILAALASASFLLAHAPAVRANCGGTASGATPCPPTPTPTLAFVSLDVTSGDATTVINVSGGQFLPNQQMNLYWDTSNHVAGFAQADGSGNFNTRVKPFPGDGPGVHKLCASVQPNPCASFSINAAPSPTPSPSPSESPSASPSAEPVVTTLPSPTPVGASLSGFDVISKPPFVFLPIAGFLGIALSLGYWLVSVARRPRQRAALPTAAVMHRATRPDYSASFGTPPPVPTPGTPQSAWDEPVTPHEPEAAAPPTPPTPVEPERPAVQWGLGIPDTGYPELSSPEEPPELPEHGDLPEPGD